MNHEPGFHLKCDGKLSEGWGPPLSSGIVVDSNVLKDNLREAVTIRRTSTGNLITNNVLVGRSIDLRLSLGLFLDRSSNNNEITNNTIVHHDVGIRLQRDSDMNLITGNDFAANTIQAQDFDGIGNLFNVAAPTGGNFWNNFSDASDGCEDQAPTDGFCDEPFVFQGGQDNLPRTQPLGLTPTFLVDLLLEEVAELIDDGAVDLGIGNALTQQLDNALGSVGRGNETAAINQVEAFVRQVEAFVVAGMLTTEQGQSLIRLADAIGDVA